MKPYLTTLIALAAATGAAASPEIKVSPLGTTNTLVQPGDTHRYLMLPVQESMPDSRVDLLLNGRLERTFYVRLADNSVDYTVPLDLAPYAGKGTVTLNVTSEADRTHSRDAADFICWDRLLLSDTLDLGNSPEIYRPAYHHTPKYGWMNDPNGMYCKDGVWHLYYQWNPYGSKWQNMTWGHSTSRDLVNWQWEPAAIEPDGLGSIFSGSAVVDVNDTAGHGAGAVAAFYTSCGNSQVQSLAWGSADGITFEPYHANPVIANPTEARDPKVMWHEPTGQWVLALAHALEKEMQFYTSPNLVDWTLRSSFGKGYGSQEGVWECPDLFELPVAGTDETRWVLLCNINPGNPAGGSGTQYFVGEFDGTTFTPDSDSATQRWLDGGKDHYATVTWSNAPDGRRTAIGWMSNWQYASDVPTKRFRSANTLPRELGLFRSDDDGLLRLSAVPSPELASLRGARSTHGRTSVTPKGRTYPLPELAEIVLDYDASSCDTLCITLANGAGEQVTLALDPVGRRVSMDRRKSGLTDFSPHFPVVTTTATHRREPRGTVRIYVDRSSVEAFDGEGRWTMTNLVFPTRPYDTLRLETRGGKAVIDGLTVYTLNPASIN